VVSLRLPLQISVLTAFIYNVITIVFYWRRVRLRDSGW